MLSCPPRLAVPLILNRVLRPVGIFSGGGRGGEDRGALAASLADLPRCQPALTGGAVWRRVTDQRQIAVLLDAVLVDIARTQEARVGHVEVTAVTAERRVP